MRILHYYDKDDAMVGQHVKLLTESMGLEAENHTATQAEQARTLLKGGQYNVLHLHGCWRNSSHSVVTLAFKLGVRLVLTPHGQLEPWVQEENRWKEKLPKRLLYQRSIVKKAYAVIIQGRMEQECMEQLGWNARTVIIRNAVVTSSITATDMARQTFAVYRKVMDSNPLELMDSDMRKTLHDILMTGITGDKHWLTEPFQPSPLSSEQWRQLLCYAHQEHITDTLRKGIRILGLEAPDIDVEQIAYFLPDGFRQAESIKQTIGYQFASENDRLMATFRYLRKLATNGQLGISHLIELDRELREHGCEEEALADDLKERRLWAIASRLMQTASSLTGLTEGFMPVTPTNDRATRKLRKQIENHLKI